MKEYNERLTWLPSARPTDELVGPIVTVEFDEKAVDIRQFEHPPRAVYFFGPEDGNVPKWVRHLSHYFIRIPSTHCLNLAAAVNVVLYDRIAKEKPQGSAAETYGSEI
jgi:tRNA(Leu) C34 or U34 (ribose-2'-O)-methylase TrmL